MWQPPHEKTKFTIPRTSLPLWRKVVFSLVGALLFGLLVYGVWYVTRLPALTISEITIVGGETISHDEVTKTIEDQLLGTYYRLVPKRFVWSYPEENVYTAVMNIPRVKQVAVERDGTTLAIAFEEYQPFALWCTEPSSPECLFIDRNGLAFAQAPRLEGGAFLRYVETGRSPELTETVFTSEYVRGSNALVEAVYERLKLNITTLRRTESDITYILAGGGEIRTTLDLSFEQTLQNLVSIFESEEFAHLVTGDFDYVDLRYGNKVFVREVTPEVASSTATSTDTQ